ncbi:molybdopterin molybdenumtransferase MoeA [Fulvivirga sp. RKSG066]|uniref:molybdopterin molybdotransferase MoeA n=1 Tax=Fulvivirga aurantia TaxID=2529383 RepID=UPI0012BBB9B3|nr:molybdopterin molybdotransferase MoeA [Fulvivirga aurantia]MTI22317.1 molybdopterin molybdenumtransferase MoeA [Fulvivirga aurantia]
MIDVEEAYKIVTSHLHRSDSEEVHIEEAMGKILDEDILADRDFPPFNRVMMDGIAIDHHAWQEGVRSFKIETMQPAGAAQTILKEKTNCIEVMTGAVLPQNTDAVIRYEDLAFEEESLVKIDMDEVIPFQNIHLRGTDKKKKDLLLKRGRKISAADVAVMATVGKSTVRVIKAPKIALVSTGDELVNIDETPHPYQIRKSNIYALQAALKDLGCKSENFHLADELDSVKKGLEKIFEEYDTIILSGGVSKGKKDYVPEVLEQLRVEKLFHRVLQRPGKPFWFGRREDDKTVFALPGNPVSTFMCFYKYVKPWLQLSAGVKPKTTYAVLDHDFDFPPTLTYYLQVKLGSSESGEVMATPVKGQGSGDLANLLEADAFLELPKDQQHYKKGEVFPVLIYRDIL